MSALADYNGFDEPDGDPPVNDQGEFICARACCDGSRCEARVSLAYMACYQHDRSAPIVRIGSESTVTGQ